MQSIKTTFTLPDYIVKELAQYAKELGEKKSHIVARALSQYFDMLDLQLAQKRSQEVHSKKVQTIPFEKIKEELGL